MNEITQTKICTVCKVEKELSLFGKHKSTKDGLRHDCKGCCKKYRDINKEYHKEYHKKNKEKKAGYQSKYSKENKEYFKEYRLKNKEYYKEYYQENRENILKKTREYRKSNKVKIKEYFIANKEKLAKKQAEYNKTPKGRAVHINSVNRRRSKTKQGDVTTHQLLQLQQNAKTCYWCNISLKNIKVNIDHYIPLSRGGLHTISNLVVSCQKCNYSKRAKDPLEFANSVGRLL